MATITGTTGNDDLLGTDFADTISGLDENDTVAGNQGEDLIYGGDGQDVLSGGEDTDTVYGGIGNDNVNGQQGDDFLYGGDVIDRVYGKIGNDFLDGGAGDDRMFGDAGNDTLIGGAGNDLLGDGTGDDTMTGGSGDDTFRWYAASGTGNDVITDFTIGEDFTDLSALFNSTTLAAYNAATGQNFTKAIDALNHDVSDGVINFDGTGLSSTNTLTMTGITGGLTVDETAVLCFCDGTRIETPGGEVPIENLQEGDLVSTLDRRPQPIRWIGCIKRHAVGSAAPVVIATGTLGNRRTLRVSPQHRMLLSGWRAELLFGET